MIVHNSYQQRGGEDTVFEAEYELLRRNGYDVAKYHVSNDELEGLSRWEAGRNAIWNPTQVRDLDAAMRDFEPDVVHVHNTLAVISPAVYHVARRYECATVHTLHNYRLLCPAATFFRDGAVCEDCLGKAVPWPAVKHGCYRGSRAATSVVASVLVAHRLMGTFREKVDLYLALTEFARAKFMDAGFPSSRLMVKPNFLAGDPGVGRGDGGYALFVGRLSPEKGLATLLTAWERLGARLPLRIVGDGPLESWVRDRAETMEGVTVLGALDHTGVAEQMKDAAMQVVTSDWYEGLAMVAVEAFAAGTPVIAPRLGALEEVVTEGHDGVHFNAGDAGSLAEAVLDLLGDPSRLAAMRQAARRTFEARYSAEVGLRGLERAYMRATELASAKRRHGPPARSR